MMDEITFGAVEMMVTLFSVILKGVRLRNLVVIVTDFPLRSK